MIAEMRHGIAGFGGGMEDLGPFGHRHGFVIDINGNH
jgi:hypothetical protein